MPDRPPVCIRRSTHRAENYQSPEQRQGWFLLVEFARCNGSFNALGNADQRKDHRLWIALFRRDRATYFDDGQTQQIQIQGDTKTLTHYIYHDDRKSLSRWLWAQDQYTQLEVEKLASVPFDQLSWGNRLQRHQVIAPFLISFYCLILHRGILDGKAG